MKLAGCILHTKIVAMTQIAKKPHWYICLLFVMGVLFLYRFMLTSQNLIRNHIKLNL